MRKKGMMALLMTTVLLATAGCGGTSGGGQLAASGGGAAEGSGTELQKLGYLSAAWSDDYCKRLNDAIVELGPEYGFEVDAVNGAPTGTPDLNGYIEGINALAEKNPDAMIVQPLFSLPDHCMQFNEKGVPLVFINISPEISDVSKDLEYYYAGCFDTAIGSQLAEEMSKGLKENAKVGMICLTYGQTNAAQRLEGFQTWMAENRPDVEIAEVNYVEKIDPANAQSIFEDWIQKYGTDGLDGVASQGSMMTQGIVESMRAHGMDSSNFIVAGISAPTGDWLRDGLEYVELFQDPYAEARAALETARAMLDGTTDQLTTLEGEYNCVAVPMTPVTLENVDEIFPKE